ncbi:MAG: hypothetical protein PHQ36_03955 [Anaerolineales bacterium]|nr:hypothetical protein [Anaerolineales bacterium]
MTTQNENANYEFQSFDPYPQAPMFPAGWDLSEMQTDPKDEENASDEESAS